MKDKIQMLKYADFLRVAIKENGIKMFTII